MNEGDYKTWPTAAAYLPARATLASLKKAAATCEGCPLYKNATQTVFGEGPRDAPIVFVGEQPGDVEDKEGRPFLGPAGKLLDQALEEVGIDRSKCYFTNAVKHFKFVQRGKRRIHSKPSIREVRACGPWLAAEIATLAPRFVVCLGATAAQALLGKDFRITKERGKLIMREDGSANLATVHPSSILRAPDDKSRREARKAFVKDLRVLARALNK